MSRIRIRKTIDSDTLHLPELRPLIGRTVEITVEEQPPAVRDESANWIAKVDALSGLQAGWNRYEAPAPSEVAIRAAREFVVALVADGQPPTRVAASAVGGVGVTRQLGERMAYFEFYNDGGACALLTDDAANERVLDMASESGTFRRVLDEVKAFLNG